MAYCVNHNHSFDIIDSKKHAIIAYAQPIGFLSLKFADAVRTRIDFEIQGVA